MAQHDQATARYSRNLSEAQTNAILAAYLIDGTTRSEIYKLAAAGMLGVPAFTVDKRYVYQVIKRRQEQFELENPTALARSTEAEVARLHGLVLKASRQIDEDTDVAEMARMAKALRDSERALHAAPKNQAKPKTGSGHNTAPDDANTNPDQTPDVIANLLEAANGKPTAKNAEMARGGSVSDSLIDDASQPAL